MDWTSDGLRQEPRIPRAATSTDPAAAARAFMLKGWQPRSLPPLGEAVEPIAAGEPFVLDLDMGLAARPFDADR